MYRALAWRLSDTLHPSEETSALLLAVARPDELVELYTERWTKLMESGHTSPRFGEHDKAALDRVVAGWPHEKNISALRDGISQLHNLSEWPIFAATHEFLHDRLGEIGRQELVHPEVVWTLGGVLGLSREEERVIVVLYGLTQIDELTTTLDAVPDRLTLRLFARMCDMEPQKVNELTSHGSALERLGLIEYGRRGRMSVTDVDIAATVSFCFDAGSLQGLTAGLFASERDAAYRPGDFPVSPADRRFMHSALTLHRPILIFGPPGIGKTEFAHALGRELGRRVRAVSAEPAPRKDGQSVERLTLVRRAVRLVDRNRDLLLVDEADALLQSAGGFFSLLTGSSLDKAQLNDLLEEVRVPAIFVANEVDRVPDSALRRFGYVYRFPRPPRETRARILSERLTAEGIHVQEEAVRRIAGGYDLTPAAVERMVAVISADRGVDPAGAREADGGVDRGVDQPGSADDAADGSSGGARSDSQDAERFYRDAEEYLRVTSRGALARETRRLPAPSAHFDPALCNVTQGVSDVVARLRHRSEKEKGTRLLFHGPPGGGKTEFALYVAQVLGRESVVRRPSDLLSPYVGVAEWNIAAMFREYAGPETVLILDEADALLADRAGAHRSWEVSQAAEFLQGIQDFEGVLLACTNRLEHVDPALRRRFHQVIEFGPLGTEQIRAALERFFPYLTWEPAHEHALDRGPAIMVSDIATAAEVFDVDGLRDHGAIGGSGRIVEETRIIQEIQANARARGEDARSIGFTRS